MSKRIGIVDVELDHFHSQVLVREVRGALADRGFDVVGGFAQRDDAGSRQWAEAHGVAYFQDVNELAKRVDCFAVLAPVDSRDHLPLCELVLPFGKPTFVDKTFAPDSATARRIFELADAHNAPIQSSSVLRYTNVQAAYADDLSQVRHVTTWGPGTTLDEYAVHPLELAVSLLGADARRLFVRTAGENVYQLLLDYLGGRSATANVLLGTETPFAASVSTEKATVHHTVDDGAMWLNGAADLLHFFETGQPTVDRRETLLIRRAMDIAADRSQHERWVTL